MLFKVIGSNFSKGANAVEYCLDLEKHKNAVPRVLKGNEKLTSMLIDLNDYKEKALFGVLSFSEKAADISDEKKLEIINRFEKAIFGDYILPHINTLWIEHSDKNGRLELNVIVPSINLTTQKSYKPYYHARDKARTALFCEIINIENNFTSPFNPERKQAVKIKNRQYVEAISEFKNLTQLDKLLRELVNKKELNSRDEIIEFLKENKVKFKIPKKPDGTILTDRIKIQLPNSKRFRDLQGDIYDERFINDQSVLELNREKHREIESYKKTRDTRHLHAMQERLLGAIQNINEYNAGRHASAIERVRKQTRAELEAARTNQARAEAELAASTQISQQIHASIDSISTSNSNSFHSDTTSNTSIQNHTSSAAMAARTSIDFHANNISSDSTRVYLDFELQEQDGLMSNDIEFLEFKQEQKRKDDEFINKEIERRERELEQREQELAKQDSEIDGIIKRERKQDSELANITTSAEQRNKEFERNIDNSERFTKTINELDTRARNTISEFITRKISNYFTEFRERIKRVKDTASDYNTARKLIKDLKDKSKIAQNSRDYSDSEREQAIADINKTLNNQQQQQLLFKFFKTQLKQIKDACDNALKQMKATREQAQQEQNNSYSYSAPRMR